MRCLWWAGQWQLVEVGWIHELVDRVELVEAGLRRRVIGPERYASLPRLGGCEG